MCASREDEETEFSTTRSLFSSGQVSAGQASMYEEQPRFWVWSPGTPFHEVDRLTGKFADELYREEEKCLEPIRLESRLYTINARRDYPVDQDSHVGSQLFIDSYLRRRAPGAVLSAFTSTARDLPVVEDTYRRAVSFRERYLKYSVAYGGYDQDTLAEETRESVDDLAEQNAGRLVQRSESIEEELQRRRLKSSTTGFNPFQKGRLSLRAAPLGFGELVTAVWSTPNLKVKAGFKKVRVRVGGQLWGLTWHPMPRRASAVFAAGADWRCADGSTNTPQVRMVAGINFGQDDTTPRDLVDVFSVTSDASYFTWCGKARSEHTPPYGYIHELVTRTLHEHPPNRGTGSRKKAFSGSRVPGAATVVGQQVQP